MLKRILLATAALGAAGVVLLAPRAALTEINQVETMAPDVYFHEGDLLGKGHCNNGWVVFEDYVLVIDANFPSGAQEVIPKIRRLTDKPIRFAFDTHHHGDHAYGNQVWVENGAVPVAHTGVVEEMRKYETGYYGNKPGRWEEARNRPDVAASKLKPPSLLFPDRMIFDDGKHRVELLHLGLAHTHGDGWAWLPKETILFSGDACVNGPYNYVGDGNVEAWIGTLEKAKQLGAAKVGPGHGPQATGSLLEDQRLYFVELRNQVRRRRDGLSDASRATAAVDEIRTAIRGQQRIARYVGDFFPAQVEKVHIEMGGKAFLPKNTAFQDHHHHAADHGVSLLPLVTPRVRN